MKWNIVEFDDFPPDGCEVLGVCWTKKEDESYWEGIVQVYHIRTMGWRRSETDEFIGVKFWIPMPGEYDEKDEFIPNASWRK